MTITHRAPGCSHPAAHLSAWLCAGITCCHGGLAPEALSGAAKRLVVSDTSWNLLKQVWAMQVVQEVGLKRAKAAKAAAQRAAAGEEDDGMCSLKGGRATEGQKAELE